MTRFEFLYLLISIFVALSLTNMASSWGALLRRRAEVQFYWVHAGWSALIALVVIQLWWGIWKYEIVDDWSFFKIAVIVTEMILLVIITAVVTPSRRFDGPLDLQKFFYKISPVFFTLSAVFMFMLAMVNLLVAEQPLLRAENAVRAISICISMFGATTRSTLAHAILVASGLSMLLLFIFMQVVR